MRNVSYVILKQIHWTTLSVELCQKIYCFKYGIQRICKSWVIIWHSQAEWELINLSIVLNIINSVSAIVENTTK